jgi:hypothetical protein
VESNSHVQAVELDFFTDCSDDADHIQSQTDHLDSLHARVSVVGIDEAEHNVTVSDGVDLIEALLHARFIKFRKEGRQHLDDFLRLHAGRVVGETLDISVKDSNIVEDVTKLRPSNVIGELFESLRS